MSSGPQTTLHNTANWEIQLSPVWIDKTCLLPPGMPLSELSFLPSSFSIFCNNNSDPYDGIIPQRENRCLYDGTSWESLPSNSSVLNKETLTKSGRCVTTQSDGGQVCHQRHDCHFVACDTSGINQAYSSLCMCGLHLPFVGMSLCKILCCAHCVLSSCYVMKFCLFFCFCFFIQRE